jgi:ribosomal protein S18 acetylase RimI-like enzyme
MPQTGEIPSAIEVFAKGFASGRCFTHPCLAEQVGPLWVIRDAERKRAADYRNEEWVAFDADPVEVDATARRLTRGRFAICAICAADAAEGPIRTAYKSLGYRLTATEPLMMHRLKRIAKWPEPFPIQRVLSEDLAERVKQASRKRQILPQQLVENAPLRLYAALDGKEAIGWLKSVTVGNRNWVANVYVKPEYRRRGIGKSLLEKMLRDDRAHGSAASILLASHTGALLYDSMGYERLGTLLLFVPKK